jgi:AcrR family transcriptional regulator
MGRPSRRESSQHDAEETRRTILQVAQRLFMEYGYRAVTTRQLAEACGLTQPALYHYFADKQELYLAMVAEEMAKIRAALERIARRNDVVPERLRNAASDLMSRVQYDLGLMLHDVRYELSPQARAELDGQFHSGFVLPIASIFEEGLRQGLLRSAERGGLEPIPAAYLFMSMLSRFTGQQQPAFAAVNKQTSIAAYADLVVRVLLHGLCESGEDSEGS